MQTRVGQKIKDLRKGMRLTQWQLGERLGVGQATVAKWELGIQRPDQENMLAIAAFFGITPEEVIDAPFAQKVASTGRRIQIAGKIAAGAWVEPFDVPEEDQKFVTVPLSEEWDGVSVTGFEVEGTSCNQVFPDGSTVFIAPLDAVPGAPKSGDMVLALREDHGTFERTLKEYVVDETGKKWLWPRSSDPLHQAPVEFKKSDRSPERVRVVGIAIGYMNMLASPRRR